MTISLVELYARLGEILAEEGTVGALDPVAVLDRRNKTELDIENVFYNKLTQETCLVIKSEE